MTKDGLTTAADIFKALSGDPIPRDEEIYGPDPDIYEEALKESQDAADREFYKKQKKQIADGLWDEAVELMKSDIKRIRK